MENMKERKKRRGEGEKGGGIEKSFLKPSSKISVAGWE